MAKKRAISYETNAGKPERARWHINPLGSLKDYGICFILTAHGFSHVINIFSIITHGDCRDIHALIGRELRHIAIITPRGVIIAGR